MISHEYRGTQMYKGNDIKLEQGEKQKSALSEQLLTL